MRRSRKRSSAVGFQVGTRSTACVNLAEMYGTRWNASLPAEVANPSGASEQLRSTSVRSWLGRIQLPDAPGALDFLAHPQHRQRQCQQDGRQDEPRPCVAPRVPGVREVARFFRHATAIGCNPAAGGNNAILNAVLFEMRSPGAGLVLASAQGGLSGTPEGSIWSAGTERAGTARNEPGDSQLLRWITVGYP